MYMQLHAVSSAYTHVVIILENQIVDETFQHTIQCSEESIKWLIKEEHYNFTAYFIEITPKVKKKSKKIFRRQRINYIRRKYVIRQTPKLSKRFK